jgi:glyoxylase-like metal-dependent hydrolase (beta-lactamase superfamily II)
MAVDIPYRREIAFEYGRLEPIAPGVRRIVARNPGPFTFKGTGTYVVGEGEVAVIDPGPELEEHIAALVASLAEEQVTHILVTHTHRDHSPAAKALKEATGAPTYGFGPHAGGKRGEAGVEEGGDWDFTPDIVVRDGEWVEGGKWRFEAVHTPGHTSNHLCFALPDSGTLFSGDHVAGAPRYGVLADPWPGDHRAAAACPRLHRASPRARGRHHRLPQGGYRNG